MADPVNSPLSRVTNRFHRLFERKASKATEVPGGTSEAADKTWRDFEHTGRDAQRELRDDASSKAYDDFKKSLGIKGLRDKAMKAIEWVVKKTEAMFNALLKPKPAVKAAMIGVGAVGGLMAMSAAIETFIPAPPRPPDMLGNGSGYPAQIDIPEPIRDVAPFQTDLVPQDDEFDSAIARFEVAIGRLDIEALLDSGREQVVLDTTPLPPPVELLAGAPIPVSLRDGNATQTGTTTLGEFYQAVPEARSQIEQHVEQNRGADIRVNITVKSGFASITVVG